MRMRTAEAPVIRDGGFPPAAGRHELPELLLKIADLPVLPLEQVEHFL